MRKELLTTDSVYISIAFRHLKKEHLMGTCAGALVHTLISFRFHFYFRKEIMTCNYYGNY